MKTKIAVYGIVEEKGKLLLLERKQPNIWEFPGGGIEFGEQPDETAKREVFEETGLEVKIIGIFSIKNIVYPDKKTRQIAVMYNCKPIGNKKICIDDGHIKHDWFSMSEIKKMKNLGLSVKANLGDLEHEL